MAPKKGRKDLDLESHYHKRVKPLLHDTPWVLRITEWQDKPPPLFVIRQRRTLASDRQINGQQTTFVTVDSCTGGTAPLSANTKAPGPGVGRLVTPGSRTSRRRGALVATCRSTTRLAVN
jgi:hypothetical protein